MKLIPYKDYDKENNLECKLFYYGKQYVKGKIIFNREVFKILDFEELQDNEFINKIELYLNSIDLKLHDSKLIDTLYYMKWLKKYNCFNRKL
jgi:hypothetical protein